MAINPQIKALANLVRNAVYGKEVRKSIADSMELTSETTEETKNRQNSLEGQFQTVIEETTGKDVISAPEIIAARGTHSNLSQRLFAADQQLAETKTETKDKLNVLQSGTPSLGVKPFLNKKNIKVLSEVDGNTRNYAGEDGIISGSVTYEDVLFYKGAKFDGGQMIEYNLGLKSSIPSATAFIRFKTLQKFEQGLNMEYKLIELVSSGGASSMFAQLHYLNSPKYMGLDVQIRNGGNLRQITVTDLVLEADTIYTLGIVWDYKEGEGNGNISIYLDGLIQNATTFPASSIPSSAEKLRVGNQTALNRPSQCALESIFFATEKIETSGMLKLHREPLSLGSIYNKNIYNPEYKVVGYERKIKNIIVLSYYRGEVWGTRKDRRGLLLKSIDEGATWEDVYDFGTSPTTIISLIEFHKNNIFICLRLGDNATLKKSPINTISFKDVITFNVGHYAISGWNFDTHNNNIIVSEYGQSSSLARVFLSKDNGETFTVIKTLPAGSQHVHNSKIDPHTGLIWLCWGDGVDATEYSSTWGDSWTTVTDLGPDQCIGIVFTEDTIIFGSDSVAGATHLRVYNKQTGEYKRLSNPTFKYLSHVYALNIDESGYLWWFGNREAMAGVVSSIYISPDLGSTPILLEDLGTEAIASPYKFVKTGEAYWLGDNKISRVVIK